MTALRAVRPNRACEAMSSSPMYASSSTIRATRRPSASSRTRRQPRSEAPSSSVGRASRPSRSNGRVTAMARGPGTAIAGATRAGVASALPDRDVELLDVERDQEPEDRDETRDQARPEQVSECRGVHEVEEAPDPRELVLALRDRRDPEERVEDHDDAPDEEERLDDTEQAANQLVRKRCFLEQRLLVVEALDHDRERHRRRDEHDP